MGIAKDKTMGKKINKFFLGEKVICPDEYLENELHNFIIKEIIDEDGITYWIEGKYPEGQMVSFGVTETKLLEYNEKS